ncbi:MAG: hypothetical protein V1933_08300 [Candidatus Omnitrophota bacterium]
MNQEVLSLYQYLDKSSLDSVELNYFLPSLKVPPDHLEILRAKPSPIFKIRPEKDDNILNIKLTGINFKKVSEIEFNEIWGKICAISKDRFKTKIYISLHLPIDKFEPNPSLPIDIYKNDEKLGNALMTGVKLTFQNSKEDLKQAFVDVSPCFGCEKIDIKIALVIIKEIGLSSEEIFSILKRSEDYFKFFYKTK